MASMLLALAGIVAALTVALAIPGLIPGTGGAAYVTGATVLGLLVALGLVRRERLEAASTWVIGVFLVLTLASIAMFGGLRGGLTIGLPIVVLLAGALGGWTAALISCVFTALGATVLLALEVHGVTPLVMDHLFHYGAWTTVVACLGMALVFLRGFARTEEVAHRRAALSERRLADLIRESPDGILSVDARGRVVDCNVMAERLAGLPARGGLGQHLDAMLRCASEEDAARLTDALAGARAGTGPLAEITLAPVGDAAPLSVEAHLRRVRHDEGAGSVQIVLRDITERIQAEAARRAIEVRAQEAQRLESLGLLAGGVAHDFRNLLTAILSNTALLREEAQLSAEGRELVDQVGEAGERAAELTSQLLSVARREIVQPSVFAIGDVLTGLEPMLRRLVPEDVDVRVAAAPEGARVCVDRGRMEQVIVNLVTNARDAMPSGGRLTLEADAVTLDEDYAAARPEVVPGRYVVLAVSDSGVGMEAAVRDRVFDPFYTTKAVGEGSGLGLATVHGIVRQADGHVAVYSEPGQGTTFKVYLPLAEGPVAAPAAPPAPPAHDDRAAGEQTVLVVDDEAMVRAVTARALTSRGYRVLQAGDGDEAVAVAAAHDGPIALMVTDVVMPGLPGPAVAAALRATRPGLRVLYLSGYTENAIVHRGQLEPDVAFLAKPFTPRTLAAAVAKELARVADPVAGA